MRTKPIQSLTAAERDLVRTSRAIQQEIADEVDVDIQTVYQWSLYYPERIYKKAAAMRVIRKHLKAHAA